MTAGFENRTLSIHRLTRAAKSRFGRHKAGQDGIEYGCEMSTSADVFSLQGRPPQ
jgi:hypothetical protein